MPLDDLAKRVREEHARVLVLAQEIRETVGVVPRTVGPDWLRDVRERFEKFRAHVTRDMALQERANFFQAVLDHRPDLSGRIDKLKHERDEMARLMTGVHRDLEAIGPEDRLLLRDICQRIEYLLGCYEHHEDLANDLATYAFTQEVGTKD